MTSLTFCVGGPAGGGGAPGVADPVTIVCRGRRYVCSLGTELYSITSPTQIVALSRRVPAAERVQLRNVKPRESEDPVDPGAWRCCITSPTSAIGNLRIIHADLTPRNNNL